MKRTARGEKFYNIFERETTCSRYLRVAALSVFFVFFSGVFISSAEEPDITVSADKTEMYIGDRIDLTISTPQEKDVDFIFPEKPEETGDFSFMSAAPLKAGFFEEKREGMVYTYSIYQTGTHVIPPVKVLYKSKEEIDWKSVLSSQTPVAVLSLLDSGSEDIRDIKGLFTRSRRIGELLAVLFGVLAVAAVVVFWMRKRKIAAIEAASRVRPADEIAYERLRELKAKHFPEKGMVKEYYIRLSEIVRHYLEDRFSFRAPEMTSEEFLASLRDSSKLRIEHKELLREFLSHCDMVKFAKYGPTPLEMLDSFGSAERLVDQTRPLEGGEDV